MTVDLVKGKVVDFINSGAVFHKGVSFCDVQITPDGKYLLNAGPDLDPSQKNPSSNRYLSRFRIDGTSLKFEEMSQFKASGQSELIVSPDGKYVCFGGRSSNFQWENSKPPPEFPVRQGAFCVLAVGNFSKPAFVAETQQGLPEGVAFDCDRNQFLTKQGAQRAFTVYSTTGTKLTDLPLNGLRGYSQALGHVVNGRLLMHTEGGLSCINFGFPEKTQPDTTRRDKPRPEKSQPDHPVVGADESSLALTVEEYAKAWLADKAAAMKRWDKKIVVLTGRVDHSSDKYTSPNAPTIWFEVPGMESLDISKRLIVMGQMAQQSPQAERLAKGQLVRIRGRFTVFISPTQIFIYEAQIESVGPDPTISVTASQLAKDYSMNEKEAEDKYREKSLAVSGVVAEVNEARSHFMLEGFDEKAQKPMRVLCGYPSSRKAEFAGLKKGQNVEVKAVGEGTFQLLGSEKKDVMIGALWLLKK